MTERPTIMSGVHELLVENSERAQVSMVLLQEALAALAAEVTRLARVIEEQR
jgi:hypothetical protein